MFWKIIKLNFGYLASNGVVPINDIRGVESMSYIKGEKIVRCKLSAVFRLMDLYGWTQGINNQVSVIIIFILFRQHYIDYEFIEIVCILLGSIKSRGRTFFS